MNEAWGYPYLWKPQYGCLWKWRMRHIPQKIANFSGKRMIEHVEPLGGTEVPYFNQPQREMLIYVDGETCKP